MNFLLERSMNMKKNMEVLITNSRGNKREEVNKNLRTLPKIWLFRNKVINLAIKLL